MNPLQNLIDSEERGTGLVTRMPSLPMQVYLAKAHRVQCNSFLVNMLRIALNQTF